MDSTLQASPGIAKMPTGIAGFDEMTAGGLPRQRTTLVMGNPGCGKTVFALQTLVNGIRDLDEPGIFISFEESADQIITNMASFGWELPRLLAERKLLIIDARLDPTTTYTGAFDLAGLLATVAAQAAAIGARSIVFDAIDALLIWINDIRLERQELHRIHDWLAGAGLTGILTIGTEHAAGQAVRRYDFLPFMVDCIVVLHHRLADRVALRELHIAKYRGSGYAANEVPFTIGPEGIDIAGIGPATLSYPVFTERVSSGVDRLDTMLEGGYYRGTSVLITGLPGTAKSTLGAAFVAAACARGERALYVSFDEAPQEIVRNMASLNMLLAPHLASGLLRMYAGRTEAQSSEEHLIALRQAIRDHQPTCLVIDPISAMIKSGGHMSALAVSQRILRLTKASGITTICTSLLEGNEADIEATSIQISTIADTWIHLSYVVQAGERNRSLTIVKARGTAHSNQVRELILGHDGIALADVYTAGGAVLMGTLRWEQEQARMTEQREQRHAAERKRRELEAERTRILAQIDLLQRDLAAQQSSLDTIGREDLAREEHWQETYSELRRLRGADLVGAAERDATPREAQ